MFDFENLSPHQKAYTLLTRINLIRTRSLDPNDDDVCRDAKFIVDLADKDQLKTIAKHMRNAFNKSSKELIERAGLDEDDESEFLKELRTIVEEERKKSLLWTKAPPVNNENKEKPKSRCLPFFQPAVSDFWEQTNRGQKVGLGMAIGSLIPLTASGITALTSLNTVTIGAIATKVGLTFAATAAITVPLALLIVAASLVTAAALVCIVSTLAKECNKQQAYTPIK